MTLRPYVGYPPLSLVLVQWRMIAHIWRDSAPPSRLILFSLDHRTSVGGKNDPGIRLFRDVIDYVYTDELVHHAVQHLRALVMDTGRWSDNDRKVAVLPAREYLHVVVPHADSAAEPRNRLPMWIRAPGLRTLRISLSDDHSAPAPEQLVDWATAFVAGLTTGWPVFLELDGVPLACVPPGFVLRQGSQSLNHFGGERIAQFVRWDDWLVNELGRMQEL
ncbi:hypothetical protein AURDEDRAFT_127526 [Auricularia subglabra TFB-10046 SS5]|nr:hypothetical protein AURDEDRAFT_127526 [Auricularia subglabra TFB-10046 SS5]